MRKVKNEMANYSTHSNAMFIEVDSTGNRHAIIAHSLGA